MPESDASRLAARVRWLRVLGFCVYVLAFFLPAVRDQAPAGTAISAATAYKGWFCALVTLSNTFSRDVWNSSGLLAILSGWINPLILIYVILLIRRNLVLPRRIIAGLSMAFMIATWIYLAISSMVPLVGHVLWIAGALMILSGEVLRNRATRTKTDLARTLQV